LLGSARSHAMDNERIEGGHVWEGRIGTPVSHRGRIGLHTFTDVTV
jgi:hypothetical protein